jgi:hypothetical protein
VSVEADQCRSFASEHLIYEVEQLHGLVTRLLQIREHDEGHGGRDLAYLDMPTRNAQVESFAIHVRSLLDFLYDVRGKTTDAVARDYIPAGWTPPEKPPSLDPVKSRVGKEIAHLSYNRIGLTDVKRQWPYLQVWLDLAKLLRAFAQGASPELLPADVANSILGLTEPPRERLLNWDLNWEAVAALSATNPLPQGELIPQPGPGKATYRTVLPEPYD